MESYYLTDSGKVRSHNEDSVIITKNISGEYLAVVADGMGGHRAGEIASSMVVSHFGKIWSKINKIGSKKDAITWIVNTTEEVNDSILHYAETNPDCKGMGTTAVIAMKTDDYLIFGNVGDSRGFVLTNSRVYQITKDHTLVNLLLDSGEIDEEQAINHPKSNVLTRAIGTNPSIEIDIFEITDEVDGIFLCSDGLYNMVSVEEMTKHLYKETSIEDKLISLIEVANNNGGKDNISVAYIDLSGEK